MNRTLRRLFSFFIAVIFVLIAFNININAEANVTDIGVAKYYVEEVKEENILPYGVKHQTVKAFTSAASGEVTNMGIGVSESFVANKYYPQQVNVLEVPSNVNLKIRPWAVIKQGEWTLAKVRDMAKDYERKNPGSKVIAAINADFFDINAKKLFPRTPSGAHASNGENYKTLSGNVVGFTNNGTSESLIGNVPLVRSQYMTLSVYDANDNIVKEFTINKVNTTPGNNETAIYFAKWDIKPGSSSQKIVPIEVENAIIVDNGEYALPVTNVAVDGGGSTANDFYGKGVITSIGSATLSTGDFAIVSNNPEVTAALTVGTKIRAQYTFTGDFADVKDIVGVGKTILYDGVKTGSDTVRHPRTMIGVKEDGTIIMTVVDGRQPKELMYGASQAEMAAVLKHYGAVEGYNLDGGGSSTMLILNEDGELEVKNSPSDKIERTDSNCILITINVPDINYSFSDITTSSLTVNADLIAANGIEIDDLYAKIDTQYQKITNGKATFTNLNPNTQYKVEFYGKKGDEYFNLWVSDRPFTAKRVPKISKVYLFAEENDYTFEFVFDDPDGAISRCSVTMNGQLEPVNKNKVTYKNFIGDITKDLTFTLTYDLNNGKGRQDVDLSDTEVTMQYGLLVYTKVITSKFNNRVESIYQNKD